MGIFSQLADVYDGLEATPVADKLPDGQYYATITSLEGSDGEYGPIITWWLKVEEGEHKGKSIKKLSYVSPAVDGSTASLNRLKWEMKTIGVGDKAKDLDENLSKGIGAAVRIELLTSAKTGKQYSTIKERISLARLKEQKAVAPAAATSNPEDVGF